VQPKPQVMDNKGQTIAETTYQRIRTDIVLGRLEAGMALKSDILREHYAIGISPLREALTRLVGERLVVSSSQRGFRVAPVSANEVQDVLNTRLLIECSALREAIEYGDIEWEGQILSAFHTLSHHPLPKANSDDYESWIERHRTFHMVLLSASNSTWLLYLADLLFDQSERYRFLRAVKTPAKTLERDINEEHQAILSATVGRNADAACKALETHYRSTSEMVISRLREDESNEH